MRNEATWHRESTPDSPVSSDHVWNSRVQWGAILAGAFAGLAVTILMGTLGAADESRYNGIARESRGTGPAAVNRLDKKSSQTLTDEEKLAAKDAADKAAKASATAAWFGLGAQLLGLFTTMVVAGHKRHTGA